MTSHRKIRFLILAAVLGLVLMSGAVALQQTAGELFEKALYVEEGQGDLQKAIGLYQDIVKKFPGEREIAAKSQLHIGLCYEKLGLKEAEKAFQKVVSDFPDQKGAVDLARERLSLLLRARAALEKSAGETRVRKVWDEAIDSFFMGTPSPDGKYLTYVDWENYANLGVRDLSAGNNRILTKNASWESGEMSYQSVVSPDGGRIAFAWQTKEGPVQMRTVGIDGSGLHVLNEGKDVSYQAPSDWSRDGERILVMRVALDQSWIIALMSAKDGSVQSVKSLPPRSVTAPQVRSYLSPDGRSIVYSYPPSPDSPNRDICLLGVDGSYHVPLVEHPADDSVLGWSPDGMRIVFRSDRSGAPAIYAVEVAAGRPRGDPQMLRSDVGDISAMGLTRDGSLLFGQKSGWSDIFVAEMDPETGKIVSEPVMIIRQNEGSNSAPDWSPDGQALACRTQEGLLVHDLRTNQTRKLATRGVGSLNFHYLRWSPDGRRIHGVGVDEKGKWGALYAIDARTGESKIIARSDEGGFLFAFDWAPDGKSLYLVRRDEIGRRRRIVRHDAASGAEEEIYGLTNSGIYGLAISPDGSQIVFATDDELRIVPSEGGEARALLKVKDFRSLTWAADGRYVLFTRLREGKKDMYDLWRICPSGGEPEKLALGMNWLMHIKVHPDGRRIAFTASRKPGKAEVWIMENFLPAAPAPAAKDETGFRVRKVWDEALDSYFMGSPSPDGRYLSYVSEEGFLGLGVRDLAKGENRVLVSNKSWTEAEYCYDSVFSPDGSRIAYACQAAGRLIQLKMVSTDGSSARILRDGKDGLDHLPFAWISDGKYVVTHYSGRDNASGVAFVSVLDGSVKAEKAISLKVPWQAKMDLSPDGRHVAGTYLPIEDSANHDLFLVSAEGGGEAVLVEHPANDVLVGWSTDGKIVLFTSDRTGSLGLWAVRVSNGRAAGSPVLVRGNLGNIQPLGLTRDGTLYYGIATGLSDVFVAPVDPGTGKVLGPPVKAVRKYETFNSTPDWSPDGQYLVCHSTRGKSQARNETVALLIRSMRTGEVRELNPRTPGGRVAPYYIRWSPDGRTILATGRDDKGQGGLLSIDAQTGEAKILATADSGLNGKGNIIAPDWSPDGSHIHYVRIGNDSRRICRLDLEDGSETEIGRFTKAGGPYWLASSPDGRQLALSAEGKIRVLSSDGAGSRELTEADSGTALAWMPDGKTILFGKDGELWRVPAAGGEPQKAGLSVPHLSVLRVCPDGTQIAFMGSAEPALSEIWVMENFLPAEKK